MKINVCYHKQYNIDLGLLNRLHPFDGIKFKKIFTRIQSSSDINFIELSEPAGLGVVSAFLTPRMREALRHKQNIFAALEVPKIPLLTYKFLDRKILQPMRWGVAGTIAASRHVLSNGGIGWNLSGGYHHASQDRMEGFCIYNDIGICHQQLSREGLLEANDRILIIDTDAHHGNGNATTFMHNPGFTLFDVYNVNIYPSDQTTRNRVDIKVPLATGTVGDTYLNHYADALNKIEGDYRMAFVVAGTDVLGVDQLGGFNLTIDDVVRREQMTLDRMNALGIPTVMLGGGGYSKQSADCVAQAILHCSSN